MKAVRNIMATALTVLVASAVIAKTASSDRRKSEVKVYNQGKRVELVYLTDAATTVGIEVKNNSGKVVYKGVTSSEKGFMLPFDMSSLPKGSYEFSLDNGEEVFTKIVKTQETIADADLIDIIKTSDAKGFVLTSKNDIPAKLSMTIYDDQGLSVYKMGFATNDVIESKYNLDEISANSFTVVVREGSAILKTAVLKF